jgi:hypothetical protein
MYPLSQPPLYPATKVGIFCHQIQPRQNGPALCLAEWNEPQTVHHFPDHPRVLGVLFPLIRTGPHAGAMDLVRDEV